MIAPPIWDTIKDWAEFIAVCILYVLGIVFYWITPRIFNFAKNYFFNKKSNKLEINALVNSRLIELRVKWGVDRILIWKPNNSTYTLLYEHASTGIMNISDMGIPEIGNLFSQFNTLEDNIILVKDAISDSNGKYASWHFEYNAKTILFGFVHDEKHVIAVVVIIWNYSQIVTKNMQDEFRTFVAAIKNKI